MTKKKSKNKASITALIYEVHNLLSFPTSTKVMIFFFSAALVEKYSMPDATVLCAGAVACKLRSGANAG
jgi:hypothetical protein